MIKVLIVTERIAPDVGPRSHRVMELAAGLQDFGCEVSVAAYLDHQTDYSKFNFEAINLGTSILGIKNSGGGVRCRLLSRFLSKSLAYLVEYPGLETFPHVFRLLKSRNFNLIISVARPYTIHWAVLLFAIIVEKKFIWFSDCGDPYPLDKPHPFYIRRVLHRWAQVTDKILVPTVGAKNAYRLDCGDKLIVVPQGVNLESLRQSRKEYVPNKVVSFGYCGTIYEDIRNPEIFLEELCKLDLQFEFHVWTKSREYFRRNFDSKRGRIVFRDIVERERLIQELSQMDFNLSFSNTTQTQTPSKLIDYYLSGRPVVQIPTPCERSDFERFLTLMSNCRGMKSTDYESELEQFNIKNIVQELWKHVH